MDKKLTTIELSVVSRSRSRISDSDADDEDGEVGASEWRLGSWPQGTGRSWPRQTLSDELRLLLLTISTIRLTISIHVGKKVAFDIGLPFAYDLTFPKQSPALAWEEMEFESFGDGDPNQGFQLGGFHLIGAVLGGLAAEPVALFVDHGRFDATLGFGA